MKLTAISLIVSISLVVLGMGTIKFVLPNKLPDIQLTSKYKDMEPDDQSSAPIQNGIILLLFAMGIIGAINICRKNKLLRSSYQKKYSQNTEVLKFNSSRKPVNMRYFGIKNSNKENLDKLRNTVVGDANFIIFTGDSGIGKRTMNHSLKRKILAEFIIIEIDIELQDARDLLMLIADRLDINKNFKSKGAFFIRFNRYLQNVLAERKKILLMIDDLSLISDKVIDELEFLSNITIRHQKIITVLILNGNTSFRSNKVLREIISSPAKYRLNRANSSGTNSFRNHLSDDVNVIKNCISPQDTIHNKARQENFYRNILGISEQTKAIFNVKQGRIKIRKLVDQSINFTGIIIKCTVGALGKVLAKIHSLTKSLTKNLYIRQRKQWHAIFLPLGLSESYVWNSLVSVTFVASALTFALWYQGVLPIKLKIHESDDLPIKSYSQKMKQENLHGKKIIQSPEHITIRAKKKLSIDQKLSDSNKLNKSKQKLPLKRSISVDSNYFIQVGAFLVKENAVNILHKLKENGYSAKIITFIDSKDRLWHTVRIGQFSSLKAAKKQAAEFSNKEKMNSIVLPLKQ